LANDFWNDPAAVEALNQQFGTAGTDLINLGAQLQTRGLSPEELQAVRELGNALRLGLRGNPELIEAEFQALVNLAEQLELSLQPGSNAEGATIRTEAPTRVPQGFEDPVAEYYRRLSAASE
jgi:hypothetical protein